MARALSLCQGGPDWIPSHGMGIFSAMLDTCWGSYFVDGGSMGIGLYFTKYGFPSSLMMTSLKRGSTTTDHTNLKYLHIVDFT